MLEIRPNCELCDGDLPANAMICSYECTYCRDCAEGVLKNTCPTCGGGFTPRPIRPAQEWRKGLGLPAHPASIERVHTKFSTADIAAHVARIKDIAPEDR